jgi:hypothetical protein
MSTVEELGLEIAELAARVDVATHRLLTCIRQFDESNGWYAQGAVSCAHWLSWRIGLDLGTARERVRVARALGKLPAIDLALATGKLSYAKVRALSRVATPENEAKLLDLALYATGAQLERICRGYRGALKADEAPSPAARSVRRRVLPGGMVKLEIVLCPDEADLVMRAVDCAREPSKGSQTLPRWSAADKVGRLPTRSARELEHEAAHDDVSAETFADEAEADESTPWPSRADGVVALAESYLAGNRGTGSGGDRYQVMVHVDQDPLAPDGHLAATLEDGTGVSAETFRRIACDCGLVAVRGDGESLSIGRRSRGIPPAIRRALQLRDHGCRFPGCTHDRFVHGHHVRHWLHGGETSTDNLVSLCTHHHHLVHEGGWSIARSEDGEWSFVAPDGNAVPAQPSHEVTGDTLLWLQEWADEHGVDLGPDANLPLWDGTRPDYDLAVSGLLAEA